MRQPWITVETVATPEGALQLQRRGERDFTISIAGRVLMASAHTHSEAAVAEVACVPLRDRAVPRVLMGGLGLGFTLRAALDALPPGAEVLVVELNSAVVDWVRGPAAAAAGGTLVDPRVRVRVGDVAAELHRRAATPTEPRLDAVVLDLYVGPPEPPARGEDPLYGSAILEATRAALAPGGRLAVWGEAASPSYERRMRAAGFLTTVLRAKGGRGPSHAIHLGIRRE